MSEKSPWQIYKENQEREKREAEARLTTALASVDIDQGIESEAEREFWYAHLGFQLPQLRGLVTQHKVPPYRLDFALPKYKIGIEIDGYEYHSDRRTFTLDRQRERDLELVGWRIIRFAGEEVFRYPDECVLDAARLVTVFRKASRP